MRIQSGDVWGGFAAAVVALPSAIGFGVAIYEPLGQAYNAQGAMAGMVGATMLGVVAAKRVGNAVVRSRAKRLMREAFRLHQHDLRTPAEIILVARDSIAGKAFAEVERDYLASLRSAGLLQT